MASRALERWRQGRFTRLDELVAAHGRVGGTGAGRRTDTQQINWALILQLAAEFQGFARDLHIEGVETFASWTAPTNPRLRTVLVALLTRRLQLDRGNANPESLAEAFERFGLQWWPALRARDQRSQQREHELRQLNTARNAIAHSLHGQIHRLREQGYPLTLATFRRWRASLNGLARTMDMELSHYLGTFFGQPRPW